MTPPKLVVRLFAGDALMLCQAFSYLSSHGVTTTPILISPWKTSRIEFEESLYGEATSNPAPATFNAIDTSNLSDHVGLLICHEKRAMIVEDKEGESTSSPLIVWFAVPSNSLLLSQGANVRFRTRPSPRFHSLLDAISTTPLEDSRHVHILAEPPFPPSFRSAVKDSRQSGVQDGTPTFTAQTNMTFTEIGSFLVRVDITDPVGQASLAAGSVVKIDQAPQGSLVH
ncbi:hypothetical protein JVU11DRAFT_7729 [Chiua virens]|nr:hypothetical protein JVU11DRAFT_7729 [Chiua virens]